MNLSQSQFIINAKVVHGEKYNYSKTKYINWKTKIKIICPIHGIFLITPHNHVSNKQGCKKCFIDSKKLKLSEFLRRANKIHKNKYDYSSVIFNLTTDKITIICPIHGKFKQTVSHHLQGIGCKLCGTKRALEKRSSNTNDFIKKSKVIHKDKYKYNLVKYINAYTKITIICPKHGPFQQHPTNHLKGVGCPKCKQSKGEQKIRDFLEMNKIDYKPQHKIEGCKYKRLLPFDFYIPSKNLLLEYQGELHYKHFRGSNKIHSIKKLKDVQRNDSIKKKFCYDNNIKLIEILYTDNIEEKLKEIFIII